MERGSAFVHNILYIKNLSEPRNEGQITRNKTKNRTGKNKDEKSRKRENGEAAMAEDP